MLQDYKEYSLNCGFVSMLQNCLPLKHIYPRVIKSHVMMKVRVLVS